MATKWVKVSVGNKIFTILIVDGEFTIIDAALEKQVRQMDPQTWQAAANIRPFSFSDFLRHARSDPVLNRKDWESIFGQILH